MALFGEDKKEFFYPNCRPIQGASNDARVVLECQPKMQQGDKILVSERPVQIVVEQGKPALITDDGGTEERVLQKLVEHIEQKRM